MPVDYQQIYEKIRQIGAGAAQRKEYLKKVHEQARQLLSTYGSELELLKSRVEAAKKLDSKFRCAGPVSEPLNVACPLPAEPPQAIVIAADGSQIIPDRHKPVQFCVVNVGSVTMRLSSGQAPEICVQTELFYGDELRDQKLMNEGAVSLRRDLAERKFVEQVSRELQGNVVNLTDGTIEIWGAKDIEDPEAYKRSVEDYLGVLSRMQGRGIPTAGYVDKPFANLVVRLLEIAAPFPPDMGNIHEYQPLWGVTDLWLFGYRNTDFQLLKPGERSAVFQLRSGSEELYKGSLSLHFFYLNVSDNPKDSQIARVEVPRWVAENEATLDSLHAVLIQQCRLMGSRPYPYVLHRAHETAVIKHQEQEHIEAMLQQESRHNEEDPGSSSPKAAAKALPGRSRR